MPFFNIAGADQLTGEQGVEQAAKVGAEIVFDELRIELGVMSNLDRTRCFQQSSERSECFILSKIPICKCIQVDDVDTLRSRKLNQPQPGVIRIKLRRFGI